MGTETYAIKRFRSKADGTEQSYLLAAPPGASDGGLAEPLPLILSPHPFGWTAVNNFAGGPDGLVAVHRGWEGVAGRHGCLIALPFGHARATDERTCLGYEGQIADLAQLVAEIEQLGYAVDRSRVYACGLSMGGQESLLLAGKYPKLVAAVFAFNPVADVAAFYEDACGYEAEGLPFRDVELTIAQEVGGTPEQAPEAYRARSPVSYVGVLAAERIPTAIWWSEHDGIVPRAASRQGKRLYDLIKAADGNAPASEYNHTALHGFRSFDVRRRIYVHEYCDFDFAAAWLLMHRKK